MCGKLKPLRIRRSVVRDGLTLTEVLVSLSLLSMAMVPILKALSQSHQTTAKLEHVNQSLVYAQSQLEELRAQGLNNYDSTWSQQNISYGQDYYGTISDTGPGTDLRTVTVETGYDANGNRRLDSTEILIQLNTMIVRQN